MDEFASRSNRRLETGYTYFLDKQGNTRTQVHSFPESLLRVGMFAEWFELRLGYNYIAQYDQIGAGPRIGTSGGEDILRNDQHRGPFFWPQ